MVGLRSFHLNLRWVLSTISASSISVGMRFGVVSLQPQERHCGKLAGKMRSALRGRHQTPRLQALASFSSQAPVTCSGRCPNSGVFKFLITFPSIHKDKRIIYPRLLLNISSLPSELSPLFSQVFRAALPQEYDYQHSPNSSSPYSVPL